MNAVDASGGQAGEEPAGFLYRYRFADVEWDEASNVLEVAGQPVAVEPLPVALLAALVRRPGEVVTRAELFETLWSGRPTVDHVLANAVNKLRKALGAAGSVHIVNVPRIGYRFNGTVERTAVGRQRTVTAVLVAGMAVPGRPDYRLVHRLGAGRHGEVWLARDDRLRRASVFKFATDGEQLGVLKREYTIYRVLQRSLGERPDIAGVLGVNFSIAPYYLECRHGGQSVPEWAAAEQRLAAMPQDARLALFLQIARAVAAAHSVGVLHKDLKPSNVLIDKAAPGDDAGWVARLTDFGSSHLLEPERLSALGVTALGLTMTESPGARSSGGTAMYLAPELLAGQPPTTASDLFSLGLMLYQFLVNDFRRPMSTGWERDVPDELLRADLAAATEGRPQDRLGSVAALIDRLESLAQRRAAVAEQREQASRAALMAAQLHKTRARRPWIVAVMAALCVGMTLSVGFYVQASHALASAREASARAQAIDDFLKQDVLQSPDAYRYANFRTASALDVVRHASQRVAQRFKGQPIAEASVRYRLSQILFRMASLTDASSELETGIKLLVPVVPPNDPLLLAMRLSYADVLAVHHLGDDAHRELARAEHDAGPSMLAGDNEIAYLSVRARHDMLWGDTEQTQDLPLALRMVELSDRVAGLDVNYRFEARQDLIQAYLRAGQADKATPWLESLKRPPFDVANIDVVSHAKALMTMGGMHFEKHDSQASEADFLAARDELIHAVGPDDVQVGIADTELAYIYETRGDFVKAIAAQGAALSAFHNTFGDEHQYTRITETNLAEEELDIGHAQAALSRVHALAPWYAAHAHHGCAQCRWIEARSLNDLHRPTEALAVLKTLSVADFAQGNRSSDWAWQMKAEHGRALLLSGHAAEGRAELRAGVDGMKQHASWPWEIARYEKLL